MRVATANILLLAAACGVLAACTSDDLRVLPDWGGASRPAVTDRFYDAYYDGYYGSFVDGFWSDDGYFHYTGRDHAIQIDHDNHFRRDPAQGFTLVHGSLASRAPATATVTPAPAAPAPPAAAPVPPVTAQPLTQPPAAQPAPVSPPPAPRRLPGTLP